LENKNKTPKLKRKTTIIKLINKLIIWKIRMRRLHYTQEKDEECESCREAVSGQHYLTAKFFPTFKI
jgi:hypothetical protein